jgi:hypothetical protein
MDLMSWPPAVPVCHPQSIVARFAGSLSRLPWLVLPSNNLILPLAAIVNQFDDQTGPIPSRSYPVTEQRN